MDYNELFNRLREANQNAQSNQPFVPNEQNNVPSNQEFNTDGKRKLNVFESGLAGVKSIGDNLMDATGFNQKLGNIHEKYDNGTLGIDDIAGAVPNFLASIPAGMVAGLTETPAFLYEALPGTKSVTQAQQDSEGNWWDSDKDLDAAQKMASLGYGAINAGGMLLGGSGAALKSASNFTRGALKSNLDDAAEFLARNASKEHSLVGDMLEEGAEEFGQSYLETIRGDENGNGLDQLSSLDTFYGALESGVLGAAGGGIMHGAAKGIDWMKNEVLADNSKSMQSQMEAFNENQTPSGKEISHDGEMLHEVATASDDYGIDQDVIPGVSSSTNIPGDYTLALDEVNLSYEQLKRSIINNEESAEMIYEKIVPEEMRSQFTLDQFKNGFMDVENEDNFINKLNGIISSRFGQIIVAATKEPSTNDSPFRFKLNRIFKSSSQASQFNPYVAGGFNMDFDGDKIKVMFGDDIVERSSYVYERLVDQTSGSDIFHKDDKAKIDDASGHGGKRSPFKVAYAYLDKSDSTISNLIRYLNENGITKIGDETITVEYVKDAMENNLSWAIFMQNVAYAAEQATGDKMQASTVSSQMMKMSTLSAMGRRVRDIQNASSANVKAITDKAISILGVTEKDLKESEIFISDREMPSLTRFALDIWTKLGFNINTTENKDNPVFRLGQALYLKAHKQQPTETMSFDGQTYSDINATIFDMFFAMKGLLVRPGEKPSDSIESVFAGMVQSAVSLEISRNFGGRVTSDNIESVRSMIIERYNSAVDEYNKAIKATTTQGEMLTLGVTEKTHMTKDTFYLDFTRTFADVKVSDFFGDNDVMFQNMTFAGVAALHGNTLFDSGNYASLANRDAGTINDFLKNCTRCYQGELTGAQNRYEEAIDRIVELGAKINSSRDQWNQRASRISFFEAVVDLINPVVCRDGLGLFTDQDFINSKYYDQLVSGNRDAVSNAITRMIVDGQFGFMMDTISGEFTEDTTKLLRSEIMTLWNRSPIHNQILTQFKAVAEDIDNAAKIENDAKRTEQMRRIREDFISTSLVFHLSNENVSYRDKIATIDREFKGKSAKVPMLASLSSTSTNSTSSSVSIKNAKKALIYLKRSEAVTFTAMSADFERSKNKLHAAGFELSDFLRWAHERKFSASDTVLEHFVYSLTTTTGAMAEKAKNTEAQNALFSMINLIRNGKIRAWDDRLTGETVDSYEASDFINNPVLIGKVIFEGKEIVLKDYQTSGFVSVNRDSLYEAITGKPRSGSGEFSSSEFDEMFTGMPQLTNILIPQKIQMVETSEGVTTSMVPAFNSMEDTVQKFIDSRLSPDTDAVENYKRSLLSEMMNEPDFFSSIAGMMQGWENMSIGQFTYNVKRCANEMVDDALKCAAYMIHQPGVTPESFMADAEYLQKIGLSRQKAVTKALSSMKKCLEDFKTWTEGTFETANNSSDALEYLDAIMYQAKFETSLEMRAGANPMDFMKVFGDKLREVLIPGAKEIGERSKNKIKETGETAVSDFKNMFQSMFALMAISGNMFSSTGSSVRPELKYQMREKTFRKMAEKAFIEEDKARPKKKRFNEKQREADIKQKMDAYRAAYESSKESPTNTILDEIDTPFAAILSVMGYLDEELAQDSAAQKIPMSAKAINDVLSKIDKNNPFISGTIIKTLKTNFGSIIDGYNNSTYCGIVDAEKTLKSFMTQINIISDPYASLDDRQSALKEAIRQNEFYYRTFVSNFFARQQSGTLTEFNPRFLDQLDKALDWEKGFVHKIAEDAGNKVLDSIYKKLKGEVPSMPTLNFSNKYCANLAGRAMVESSASIVATSTGTSGKHQKEAAAFGLLRPYFNECTEANLEINLTPNELAGYDGCNLLISPELAEKLEIRDLELKKRTRDGQFIVILNDDRFRAKIATLTIEPGTTITVHDQRRSGNGCNCWLCNGSPFVNGSKAYPDGMSDIENFSALSDIVGMIHKFAMEPRLLKKKKTFPKGSAILPDFDRLNLTDMYTGAGAMDFNAIYGIYQNNREIIFNHINEMFKENVGNLAFYEPQARILTSALTKDVWIDFGEGRHMLLHQSDIVTRDKFIEAIARELELEDPSMAEELADHVKGIKPYIYSLSELAAKISTGTYKRVRFSNTGRDDVHHAANEAWNDLSASRNFIYDKENNKFILNDKSFNLRSVLSKMTGMQSAISTEVSVEDSATRLQRIMADDAVRRAREEVKPILVDYKKEGAYETLLSKITNSDELSRVVPGAYIDNHMYVDNDARSDFMEAYKEKMSKLDSSGIVKSFYDIRTKPVHHDFASGKCGYMLVESLVGNVNQGHTFSVIDNALRDGFDLVITKDVFDQVKHRFNPIVRESFEEVGNYVRVRSVSYIYNLGRFQGKAAHANEYYLDRSCIGIYVEGDNLPDSSVIYNDKFIKNVRIKGDISLSVPLPDTIHADERREFVSPKELADIDFSQLDLSHLKDTDSSHGFVEASFERFKTSYASKRFDNGYNLSNIKKDDVIGVMKVYGGLYESYRYVPILMQTEIPVGSDVNNIRIDNGGRIAADVYGTWGFDDFCSFKTSLRGLPYKAFAVGRKMASEHGANGLKIFDAEGREVDWAKFGEEIVNAWPVLADGREVDGIFDRNSLIKRLNGLDDTRLMQEFYYASYRRGYNLFTRINDDGSIGFDSRLRPEMLNEIISNKFFREEDTRIEEIIMGDGFFDAEHDNINKALRRLLNACKASGISISHVISSYDIDITENGQPNFKKISHHNRAYDFEAIWSQLDIQDLFTLYNAFDDALCPPDRRILSPEESERYFYDADGKIKSSVLNKDGIHNRIHVVTSPIELIDPKPHNFFGGTARLGMQFRGEQLMQHGLPNDKEELLDLLSYLATPFGEYSLGIQRIAERTMNKRYKKIHKDDFNNKWNSSTVGSMKLEEMLSFTAESRAHAEWYDKMIEIAEHRNSLPIIDNLDMTTKENIRTGLANALGVEPGLLSDRVMGLLFSYQYGWEYGDGQLMHIAGTTYTKVLTELTTAIENDTDRNLSWIKTDTIEGRASIPIFDPIFIDFLIDHTKYGTKNKEELINIMLKKADELEQNLVTLDSPKRIRIEYIIDYMKCANGHKEKVSDIRMMSRMSNTDFLLMRNKIGDAYYGSGSSEAKARFNAEWERSKQAAESLAKMATSRKFKIQEDEAAREGKSATTRNGDRVFTKYLNNLNILQKMMKFIHIDMPFANGSDRAIGTIVQRAMMEMSLKGFGPFEALKDAASDIPRKAALAKFSKSEVVKKLWRAQMLAEINGDGFAFMQAFEGRSQDAEAIIDEYLARNGLEKAFNEVAYVASAGNFFMDQQIQNFVMAFTAKAKLAGMDYWFEKKTITDAEGNTREVSTLEAMLEENPVGFLSQVMTPGNPSFLIAQQALNFSKEGDKAQKNVLSLVYEEIFSKTTAGKFLFETGFCAFPTYKTNQIGNILGWVAPISSLHFIATKILINHGDTMMGGKFKGLSGAAMTIQNYNTIREAMFVDATRMSAGLLATVLFGLAAFQPPDDEDKLYNIDEWTIFGLRVCDEWWISDMLGLALPMAASWKLAAMGKANPQLLINGIAKACYNNPALRISDAVDCVLDPDITLDDFVDDEYYENSYDGSPTGLEWLAASWQSMGLSYLSQFFTPSIARELYTDLREFEVSSRRVYEENSYGHLTEDGANGKTMITTFADQQLRKVCKNNPMVALMCNAIFRPNTSYWAYDMPKTVYYDTGQIESAKRFSIYEEDGVTQKSDAELSSMFVNIYSIMNSYEDMDDLVKQGFYLDYDTKSWISKQLWGMVNQRTTEYYAAKANGEFNPYTLGNGNYEEGYKISQELQQAYWDDINAIKSFYYDKLWSEPMRKSMTAYNRYNTTYEQDANGNWYATGYRRQASLLNPFMFAAGTLSDPEDTAGYSGDWASLSAVNGQGMYDENRNGMRALVAVPLDTSKVPDFDSWGGKDVASTNSAGNKNNSGSSGLRYGGGSGGSGGGYGRTINIPRPNINAPRPYTMDVVRTSNTKFDYLRPSFETKGSRDAYRREDI